jgi:hypothetical protein
MVKGYVESVAKKYEVQPKNEVVSTYSSGKPSQVTTKGQDGRTPTNTEAIIEGFLQKASSGESYTGELIYKTVPFKKATSKVDDIVRTTIYTYRVEVWGNVGSDLATFKAQAAETLNHYKGWSAAGIGFREVTSGGDFVLALATPARVAGASSICDAYYSCSVGNRVMINDDRWAGATPAWNGGGGNLRDYRHMVVNHEVGHWLGFGHGYCSGAGQLAPVMQQQSVNLQGCKFNPWPLESEIRSL